MVCLLTTKGIGSIRICSILLVNNKFTARWRNIMNRNDWEREIINIIIDKCKMPNGDAQGVVEARNFEITQEWGKGSTPEEAATRIIKL